MDRYFIYKVSNSINGKIYIGFTKDLHKRIIGHRAQAKNINPQYPLYRAFNKYGFANFSFEIIYCSLDREHTLTIMEPLFIKEYNSKAGGYNQTLGGEGTVGLRFKMPQSAIEKIRMANTGHKITDFARDAISKVWKVISPDGTEVVVKNLKLYCLDKELCADNLYAVAKGKRKHHKNYRCMQYG